MAGERARIAELHRTDPDFLPWRPDFPGVRPLEVRRRNRDAQADFSLKQATERLEREYIPKTLAATGGNRTQAARLLEISLRALLYKIKEYGIE